MTYEDLIILENCLIDALDYEELCLSIIKALSFDEKVELYTYIARTHDLNTDFIEVE